MVATFVGGMYATAAGGVYALIQGSARAARLEGGRERAQQRMRYQQYQQPNRYAHYD